MAVAPSSQKSTRREIKNNIKEAGKRKRMKLREMQLENILKKLRILSNPKAVEGMARFGINANNTLGVTIPDLRKIAKEIGKDYLLAQELWASGIHEARILVSMIREAEMVTEEEMEGWVKDFNSWDVCDQFCNNLFYKTKFAYKKANEWSKRKEEFVKRAGFALMASLAVHDKNAGDEKFLGFLSAIKRESKDERNFVKKAINWALRQIGKRNINLNNKAIETAEEIQQIDSKSAKWIAQDAIRELTSKPIQERLKTKAIGLQKN